MSGAARGRAAFWLASIAVAWMAVFATWALTQDFVRADDDAAFIRVAVLAPVAVAVIVWMGLHAACSRDLSWARAAAHLGAWLLVAYALVTGFTIGLLLMPAALALAVAAAFTPVAAR